MNIWSDYLMNIWTQIKEARKTTKEWTFYFVPIFFVTFAVAQQFRDGRWMAMLRHFYRYDRSVYCRHWWCCQSLGLLHLFEGFRERNRFCCLGHFCTRYKSSFYFNEDLYWQTMDVCLHLSEVAFTLLFFPSVYNNETIIYCGDS